ncbi:lysophospholipid acyltransferase family protein [Acinetobacter kookii]|uniref:lysophospholipid acyltransferase family protein n=1 Tax=unclassified Acinetobacter TaxID=196816 RepID=UPI0021B7C7D0|nr:MULTISPECIES: lysophospholipid acyltransferase family protein [unclassified Acinetobacter]MCT8090163.1 1-acyl-sn-glycerol-3-phosphate acyltransferase [Acinetobacter sp. F_3_1]MCT8098639.1 1-acyl-sn-glycerol-3-phosphate acyltransferase [Acinetobacter sp. C_3_1]MCT8101711.1 1-acyl-sn-glycerol-3-phosphate acyltransferase [Acinetobacter sp. C_4_1]MCT8135533.1 1-acyl-sn-glycerol-3-phosphate acyltransferase [Acinetobacter sp. T_3_1]
MAKMLKRDQIKQKANYLWRVGATGFSFASFGIGGVAIGGLIAPLVKLSTQNPGLRQQRTQKVIKHSFKGFTEMMVKLGIMTYDIEGLEKLQHSKQELVIANHPTLVDVVVLIGLMEQANCVVKQALWSNPFTKGPVQNAGYILNAGSELFIHDCVARLKQDQAASLLIFPEGTRTAKGELLNEFQRGAANIAIRANVPIRPVLISCTPSTLTKNEKWYHVPSKPFHIHVKVLDAIQVDDLLEDVTVNPKHVRQLNHQLHQFFNQELSKK